LSDDASTTWRTWLTAWYAAHWTPGDAPALRVAVRLYDAVLGGRYAQAGELRIWCDNYGITPKGQQDRRWTPPKEVDAPAPSGRLPVTTTSD
jgi:hypothetical protein